MFMDANNNARYTYSMANMIYLLSENFNMDLKAPDSVSTSYKFDEHLGSWDPQKFHRKMKNNSAQLRTKNNSNLLCCCSPSICAFPRKELRGLV